MPGTRYDEPGSSLGKRLMVSLASDEAESEIGAAI
jgi:hypothetical protein